MGTFDAEGNYTPRKVTERDVSFVDSINETMVELKEGKLVTGTVVRITRDEVLLRCTGRWILRTSRLQRNAQSAQPVPMLYRKLPKTCWAARTG